jgi:hypothetical protein
MQYLSRLVAENGERYYLLSKCDEREVHDMQLLLTDGCDVWEKTLSKEDLKKLSKEASMEFRPYVEETLKALTKIDIGSANFQYEVKIGGSRLQLIWKRVLLTDSIKFQLGSAVLQKQSEAKQHMMSILDFTIGEIDHWKSLSNRLESDVSQLSGERANALKVDNDLSQQRWVSLRLLIRGTRKLLRTKMHYKWSCLQSLKWF